MLKVAVIGSRGLTVEDLGKYLPPDTEEIVSGGARGVDSCAKTYAAAHGLRYKEFLPEYEKYGKGAPLKRNDLIVDYADEVLAFWDGISHGTGYVIDYCHRTGKPVRIFRFIPSGN